MTYPRLSSCRWWRTTFRMQVLYFLQRRLPYPRSRTSNRGPPLVNSFDSTGPGTLSSAFLGSSYPKAVEAKASTYLLSVGNFRRSVFVSRRCIRVRVRVRVRVRRRNHCCRSRRRHCCQCCHRRRIRRRRVQPITRYQRQGEDVLVVVAFVTLRESLGLINCFGSLLLANSYWYLVRLVLIYKL